MMYALDDDLHQYCAQPVVGLFECMRHIIISLQYTCHQKTAATGIVTGIVTGNQFVVIECPAAARVSTIPPNLTYYLLAK